MIERKQFIENCNNSRILESFLIDPIDGENAIAYNLSFDYIPKKKKENQRRINYINQFTKRVNLQIYEEARKRFEFTVLKDRKEIKSLNLEHKLNEAELDCYTDQEINEMLVAPIIEELVEFINGGRLSVDVFVTLSPPLNGKYVLLTSVKRMN